tara:strand:- start:111 stop:5813 length:5703 start_codon:yes stop_codon:yes gene_type:complete
MATINYNLNNKVVPVEIPEAIVDPTEQDNWVKEVYYPYYDAGLATAAEDSSHPFSGLPDWAARGFYRLGQQSNIMQTQLGLDNPENAAKDIGDYQRHLAKVPYDENVIDTLVKFDESQTVGEFWDAATTLDGLETIATVAGESLAQYAPALATTLGVGIATAGSAAPAIATTMIGAVAGLGSLAVEYGASSIEAMSEYLNEQGSNISDNRAVADVLSNEEKMEEFTDFAFKRGIPIAVIDGLSVGLAGKLTLAVRGMEKSSKAARIAAFGTEALAIQPALGGLGEYTAQKVAGQDFKLGDIALEVVAEVPGGTVETGIGLLVDKKRQQKQQELKDLAKAAEEEKIQNLKDAPRADEFNIVTDDLVSGAVNPETGVSDAVIYEERIVNYSGQRPKAGERAIDKSGIKNIFNLKNPKSINAVIKHLKDKKLIIDRPKSKGFNWTVEAEKRYDAGLPIEKVKDVFLPIEGQPRSKKQILSTAKVYKERKLEPPPLTLEEEAIEVGDPTLATDYIEADVDVTEQIDTSNKPYSFTIPPMIEETLSETEINEREDLKNLEAYIQNEINTTGTLPLEAIEDINNISLDNIREDTRSKIEQGKIIRAENPNILQMEETSFQPILNTPVKLSKNQGNKDFPRYFVTHPNAASYLEGTGEGYITIERSIDNPSLWVVNGVPDIDSTFSQRRDAVATVEGVLNNYEAKVTIDRKAQELDAQREESVSGFKEFTPESFSSDFEEFATEVTENSPKPVKEKLKDFKLRREGRDIPVLDNQKTNVAEIIAQQQLSIGLSPANEMDNMNSQDRANVQFKAQQKFFDKMTVDMRNAANQAEREEKARQMRERAKEMNIPELVSGVWSAAYKVFHPQRLGELFKTLRPFSYAILQQRESREQKQQKPFAMLYDFLSKNTTTEDHKKIGSAYLLLDAFFGPRKTAPLNQESLIIAEDGSVSFIIPDEPPSIEEEDGTTEPVVDQELYEIQLKEMGGFKPGDEITLTAFQWEKIQEVNSALKESYSSYITSFLRFLLQKHPLASGIEQNFYDTPLLLQKKLTQSVLKSYAEINNLSMEEVEQYRNRINNTRDKKWVETLLNEKKSIEDTDLKILMDRVIAQSNMIKMINEYKQTLREHPFYIPRLRYGDFYFTVYDKKTEKIVGYYTSPPMAADEILGAKKQEDRLNAKRNQIKKSFPESRFKISRVKARDIEQVKTQLSQRDLTLLERLLMSMAHRDDTERPKIIRSLMDEAEGKLNATGFGKALSQRSPDLVLGYFDPEDADTYLPTQASNYIRSSANAASSLEFYNPLNQILKILREGSNATDPEDPTYIREQSKVLYKLAQRTYDSINSPTEPGSLFKSIAFHYALGGNFSSAFVNLTQTFVTTIPMLSTITGFRGDSATKEVVRGLSDARKLFKLSGDRVSSYGFRFDQEKKPKEYSFLTDKEYTYLRNLYNEGVIQAIVNLDLGAKYQQQLGQVLGKGGKSANFANNLARVMDASAFMFGAVEQINRISTALAAYRLAVKSEKNLKNFEKYSKFTVFADQEMTPELAGKMAVYQTQFLIGKENRPELFRSGIMNVGTQFLSFVMQYTTMYFRVLQMFKVEPRMAATMLGGLVLSMMFFGGAMGLPFMENLRQLLSKLSKGMKWSGGEFDLEYGIRQALIDSKLPGLSQPEVVEMLTRGVASRLLGADISKRVSAGEIIPFSFMDGDLMAATGPFGSLMADVILNMNKALEDENYTRLITSVLPLAPRYAIESGLGVLTDQPIRTSQGRMLLPSEDISGADRLKQTFGFTPKAVSDARRDKQVANYLDRKMRGPQDRFLSKLARLRVARRNEKDINERADISRDIQELRDEVRTLNRIARKERRLQDVINISPRALRDRERIERQGQAKNLRRDASKRIRPILKEKLEELVPK